MLACLALVPPCFGGVGSGFGGGPPRDPTRPRYLGKEIGKGSCCHHSGRLALPALVGGGGGAGTAFVVAPALGGVTGAAAMALQ